MPTPPAPVTHRKIEGISAVLLPFTVSGNTDIASFLDIIQATVSAGLIPAVNMDTGYTNMLKPEQRSLLLRMAANVTKGAPLVAGAYAEGAEDPEAALRAAIREIRAVGGTPILFPTSWLKQQEPQAKVESIRRLAKEAERLLVFELGEMFVPFGEIWDDDTFRAVLDIPEVVGSKHSSLDRLTEWKRLKVRNEARPDFRIYTGNDLAIDMVMWGSDYLLGLSAFYPEAFAIRDLWWSSGDPRFYGLNDALQYLGAFAFRSPVPAYKHSCAQFLTLRGRISSDAPHPDALRRPETDLPILESALQRIEEAMTR